LFEEVEGVGEGTLTPRGADPDLRKDMAAHFSEGRGEPTKAEEGAAAVVAAEE
jgi:hypothetical protein